MPTDFSDLERDPLAADEPIRIRSETHAIELLDGWIAAYEHLERLYRIECMCRQGLAERVKVLVEESKEEAGSRLHEAGL